MSDIKSSDEPDPRSTTQATLASLRAIVGGAHVLVDADVACRSDSWPRVAPMEASA